MDDRTHPRLLKPIPVFSSRDAEAEFWDTHDLTDYASFDNPARFGPIESGLELVGLHVDSETLDLARAIAAERNVPWEGLLELWLIERREAERERRAAGPVAPNREIA